MSAKKSYNRFFIIFQEEDKGYGLGPDRPPTGYVKVETKSDKGKVTVYVQNLKPFENAECLYRCYLISHQDNRDCATYLGIMNIDDMGRGESSWETSAENAFNLQISMDKFNGAAIVVDGEGIDGVVAPLAGYMTKEKFQWRSLIPQEKVRKDVTPEVVEESEIEAPELAEEAKKFDEYEKEIQELAAKDERTEAVEDEEKNREAAGREEEGEKAAKEEEESREAVEEVEEESREAVEEAEEGMETVEEAEEPKEEHKRAEKLQKTEDTRAPAEDTSDTPAEEDDLDSDGDDFDEEYREDMEEEEDLEFSVEDVDYEGYMRRKPKRPKHKKYKKDKCCLNYDYMGYMGSHMDPREKMKEMLEDILKDCEEMGEIKDLKDCKLWKIDMKKYSKDRDKIYKYPLYDLIFYPMMYNPYCNYYIYIRRHGHYYVGIRCDKKKKGIKHLIFGIPGANNPYEQPFQGMTGFTKWVRWEDDNDMGCWIMAYDPLTGILHQER